jgi:hypothetical protein
MITLGSPAVGHSPIARPATVLRRFPSGLTFEAMSRMWGMRKRLETEGGFLLKSLSPDWAQYCGASNVTGSHEVYGFSD